MKTIMLIFVVLFASITNAQTKFFTRSPSDTLYQAFYESCLETPNEYVAFGAKERNGSTVGRYAKTGNLVSEFITDSIYEGYHNFNLYFSQATTRLKLLNNSIYRPTYRYFPGYNMASPSLVKINATGHIDSVWDYTFSKPTRFTHYDYRGYNRNG